jgi:hypothetical protein
MNGKGYGGGTSGHLFYITIITFWTEKINEERINDKRELNRVLEYIMCPLYH